jgi:SOS response regulatory protein OraA/RecX
VPSPARDRREGSGKRPSKRKDIHERALGLLAVRQRSRRELERRLVQAGFEPDAVAVELGRLEQVGLIDDAAFAAAVVESRMGARGESRRAVGVKLSRRGSIEASPWRPWMRPRRGSRTARTGWPRRVRAGSRALIRPWDSPA